MPLWKRLLRLPAGIYWHYWNLRSLDVGRLRALGFALAGGGWRLAGIESACVDGKWDWKRGS